MQYRSDILPLDLHAGHRLSSNQAAIEKSKDECMSEVRPMRT